MDQSDLLHGNGKKPISSFRRRYCSTTAVTLLLFVLTNTVSILVSSGAVGPSLLRRYKPATILPFWDDSAALLADLNDTQAALAASRAELASLYARVGTANELLRTLLDASPPHQQQQVDFDGWAHEPTGELKLALGPAHGRNGTTELILSAVGHACRRVQADLERFMNYTPGGACPSDEALAHRLKAMGCDPLPRRRCRPPSPKGYTHPLPLPASLWTMPPDTSVVWDDAYHCKNYSCLVHAKALLPLAAPQERRRWARDDGKLDYSIDAVLRARPNGTVRIGLDIIGVGAAAAAGTFAARMMERGVTVVTTAVDAGGAPLGGFIAARGLVPVHVGVAAARRLPFFDGTLDIVHQLGNGGEGMMVHDDDEVMLEFAMFDVYRVLRPGGLFWIDHFVFTNVTKLNATFAPMIDRVGFKKLRWNTGRKVRRRGAGNDEWYVSALLEKPMT